MADLTRLARTGTEIAVRVTPKASKNRIALENGVLRVWVTAAPEGGKANRAVQKHLAKALGIAKTRLVLIRGEASRSKLFRID